MAGLRSYLDPRAFAGMNLRDPELDPAPASPESIAAVSNQSQISPALQKYLELSAESAAQEQQGLSQLQNYIQQYQEKPQGIDFTPLAAWADSLSSRGGSAYEVAKGMKPPTEEERDLNVMKLQDTLQQRKGEFTKTQMDRINAQLKQEAELREAEEKRQLLSEQFEQKQQLAREKAESDWAIKQAQLEQERIRTDAYREQGQMRKDIAQMQLDASRAAKEEAQRRADERQKAGLDQKRELKIADQVVKIGKELSGELPALSGNIAKVEEILGVSLDTYDPTTKSFGGQKIDAPGKSVMGVGRMYMPGGKGEELDSAFKGIFNSLLKQRSGAAVTNQELARLRSEFASGAFNTEEKMLEALHRFKKALRKEMLQKEKSYLPEAVERYRDQGGALTEDLLGMEPPPPQPERKEWGGKIYELKGDTWVEVK